MKALMKYQRGPGNMEIRDVPEPGTSRGEVKIERVRIKFYDKLIQ